MPRLVEILQGHRKAFLSYLEYNIVLPACSDNPCAGPPSHSRNQSISRALALKTLSSHPTYSGEQTYGPRHNSSTSASFTSNLQ